MADNQEKINQLLDKLNSLLRRQDEFSVEINNLKIEIDKLNTSDTEQAAENTVKEITATETNLEIKREKEVAAHQPSLYQSRQELLESTSAHANKPPKKKSNLEKFIGENLINKIGIVITIIGVAIGAKYSIDHDLISPLTRVILGYLTGLGLLGFGIKLKKKYENYSAVLVSGAMAILYFMTYSAYSFYGLIPQVMAFALMVVFTSFTVIAAINYNREVIAHIGLVAAYAVPFLLSEGSGEMAILFTYMAIINTGILIIAFKKYWKRLYYFSFGLTWLIYFVWSVFKYQSCDFGLALIFLSVFFCTFYLTFLAYKLLQKEKFEIQDIILLFANSFIFYGMGYMILNSHNVGRQLLGLFTHCNAVVHIIVAVIIYRKKLADRNLFFFVSGLVLTFITMAIPIQLDGNWVTLLWTVEATLLFWIGKTKNVSIYEKLAYPLMILAFLSMFHDWMTVYNRYVPARPETKLIPLFNIHFLTSMLFIAAFSFINVLKWNKNYPSALNSGKGISKVISFLIPGILLFTIYYAFRIEIANYWNQLYIDIQELEDWVVPQYSRYDLLMLKRVWIINYTLFFVSLLAFVNLRKLKNLQLGLINLGLIALTIVVFLTEGLSAVKELSESYLGLRYISFAFVALSLFACYKYLRQDFIQTDFRMAFDFLLYASVLWIFSNELTTWMYIVESTEPAALGLSILWGTYSLFLIALGIRQKKKYLRIGAVVLFGVTLIKVFLYDISHLDTVAKTMIFISLGVLLLIISFLYNKYKHVISDETSH